MAPAPADSTIHVLVVDDETDIRDAYRHILVEPPLPGATAEFSSMRDRLFKKAARPPARRTELKGASFRPVFCDGATAAVAAVRQALAARDPFSVVFLDMRMPPGPDGVWAAAAIRELDPQVEIVVCTAYSDVNPGDIGGLVPPEEKLAYLQKPFHPHEIRQMAISLASKWRAERRAAQLASFDALTALPNREHSRATLHSELALAQRQEGRLAVLYLDLDDFKRVNDTLGHAVGDELLREVASRLRGAVQPAAEHVARLGGDEFGVILPRLSANTDASDLAARLVAELRQPMRLGPHTVVVTPSVGISLYPEDGRDVDTLMRNADLAMYVAKRRGAGQYSFFNAGMNDAALRRFTLEAQLRGALEREEFSLHYQPQFEVSTGKLSGMEALLRWTNGELGEISPEEFIPIAEHTGLIFPIGAWVLRTACRQAKSWLDSGLPVVRMAVNVSGHQFALADFPGTVAAVIEETGLDASRLELEITESVVVKDEDWAETVLRQLKGLGVLLAIDDFGTGYSSFGRLRHFAVDRLKIDRSFITSLNDRRDDRAIAAAIISMSRSLQIQVTAEGVETFPQLLFLQEHHCQDAQGYLFSRPLPAEDARRLLERAAAAVDASRTARLRSLIG